MRTSGLHEQHDHQLPLAIACYIAASVVIALRLFRSDMVDNPRLVGMGLDLPVCCCTEFFLYQNIFTGTGVNLGFFDAGALVT